MKFEPVAAVSQWRYNKSERVSEIFVAIFQFRIDHSSCHLSFLFSVQRNRFKYFKFLQQSSVQRPTDLVISVFKFTLPKIFKVTNN